MDFQTIPKEELILRFQQLQLEFDAMSLLFEKERESHRKKEFDLGERLKELTCHNQISEIMSISDLPAEEMIRRIVKIIPDGWQFPSLAEAAIRINGKTFATEKFEKTPNCLSQPLKIKQQTVGRVEVCYPVDRIPAGAPQLFLPEETNLLFSIAERLNNYIEKEEEKKALSESTANYLHLIENINDAIYNIDNKGIILYISPSIEKILGFTPQEVIGANFIDFVGESGEHLAKRFLELQEKLEIQNEYKILSKTGKVRWIRLATKAFIKDGQFMGGSGTLIDLTEQKEAEEKIRYHNERLNAIIHAMPDLIFVLDKDGTYLEFFASEREKLLLAPEKIIGSNIGDAMNERLTVLFLANIHEVLDQKEIRLINYVVTLPDGAIAHFEARIAPVDNEKVLVLSRDITAQVKKETEIKKLSLALEQTPVSILITDLNSNIEYANPAFEKTTGYTREEVIGLKTHILKSGKTDDTVYKELWETITLGKEWDAEWLNKKKNGELYWENISISPIHDNEGEITNYLAVKQDITERKLSEELLRQNEEKYRYMFVNNPQPMWIYDLETLAFLEINNAALDHYGYTRAEFLSMTLQDIRPREDMEDFLKDVELTQKNHNNAGEWRHLKKNGEIINVEIISHAITFNNRKARHVLVNDITKQKKVEQEIRELNASLEYRISERTMELTEINENLSKEIEQRVKVVEALQQKTAELENFFSVTVDLLLIADTSGRIVKVNAAWEVILGYTVEELRDRNFLELIHPDDIEATLGAMGELKKQNPVFNFINRYKKKDGAYRYIEWNSALSNNLFYAAARDITESRQAEEFEAELLKLSPKLTGISFAEIDNALYLALSRIGQFLGADRSSIYEFSPDGITFNNTYEWCSNSVKSPLKDIQRIPGKNFPAWMEAFKIQDAILIPSVEDLPESWSAEKEAFKAQGIQSLIIIPMFNENKLIGFVALDTIREKRVYTSAEINILKVWSSMLASLINNKRVESLLEQTRQNYETFFNTIEDFLFIFNENGHIIDINQTVIQRLGYTSEELINQSILMVRPSERIEEVLRVMKDMLSGNVGLCTIPLLTKSGVQIPVETKVKRGLWNGQPVIFGVSKDISQIKISEQKFSSAFHANSAMMTISKIDDGKFVDVNRSTIETMGYSREEIIGKTGLELGFFVDQEIQERIYETKIRNIPFEKIEVQLKTKDNRLITGIMSCETIFVGDEKCLLTVVLDISDRKKGEEELRKARIESEQANKAKSEFLSRMSHELRTPMNSILGFAQLLKMGDLNPGQKKGLNHIMHSGKHLLDLINEVLDISRIEAGRLSLSLEPVQLDAIILETIDIVRPQSNEYAINIELISSPDNQLFVKSDRQRLKQVLLNLINNAIKYNRKGGSVYVTIELQETTAENLPYVRVSITDTGIGIVSEDIPKLFKPFERIGADKTATEGTGLGLAVVQKLTAAMGGKLGIESILGEGSTFWIELPVIERQLAKIKNSDGNSDPESEQLIKTGTILYIEDNSSNIELVEQIIMIQRPNIKLITNMLGKNAATLAMENKPDLILLDLNLPDIHGTEVLQLLKSEVSTSTIPVVVISADAMLPQIKNLLSAGAKDYLTKPIEIDDFLRVIDQYMGKLI